MALQHTSKLASIPRLLRLLQSVLVELVTHAVTLWSTKAGGWSLVSIAIPTSMDPCHVFEPLCGIELKRQEGWGGRPGLGMTNTRRIEKDYRFIKFFLRHEIDSQNKIVED